MVESRLSRKSLPLIMSMTLEPAGIQGNTQSRSLEGWSAAKAGSASIAATVPIAKCLAMGLLFMRTSDWLVDAQCFAMRVPWFRAVTYRAIVLSRGSFSGAADAGQEWLQAIL